VSEAAPDVKATGSFGNLEKLCAVCSAGAYGSLEVGGKSWRVGLSTEYGLTYGWSGGCNVAARCSPEENLVAKGDAVDGSGFLRTGDDDVELVEVMEERVSVRDRTETDRFSGRVTVVLW